MFVQILKNQLCLQIKKSAEIAALAVVAYNPHISSHKCRKILILLRQIFYIFWNVTYFIHTILLH